MYCTTTPISLPYTYHLYAPTIHPWLTTTYIVCHRWCSPMCPKTMCTKHRRSSVSSTRASSRTCWTLLQPTVRSLYYTAVVYMYCPCIVLLYCCYLLSLLLAVIVDEEGGLEKVSSSHGLMQQDDDKGSDMVFNVVNQGYTPPAAAATATPAPIPTTTTGDEHTPLYLIYTP